MPTALRLVTLLIGLSCLYGTAGYAQDIVEDSAADTAAPATAEPSMQDVLNALEQEPAEAPLAPPTDTPVEMPAPALSTPAANVTVDPATLDETPAETTPETPPANSYIVPPAGQQPSPVSAADNSAIVPAQPLENMNPALMPDTPADEAPKAVRAETPPVPPKPPAYNAQPYVTLQTLDKVTARTNTMIVKVGDTVAIGPLFVQVKICQQAAPLETPDSAAFLEIWEAKPKDSLAASRDNGPSQWVFSGWMFASSPALSAMDHPIYDIWVLNCKKSAKDVAEKSDAEKPSASAPADTAPSSQD